MAMSRWGGEGVSAMWLRTRIPGIVLVYTLKMFWSGEDRLDEGDDFLSWFASVFRIS
jgi:hypothetical protein